MAVSTVRVQINGVWTILTLNTSTGLYEATLAAPNITSFNKAGGFYDVTVEATDLATNVTTVDSTHSTLGNNLKLWVKEITKPTITITAPTAGAYVVNNKTPIKFQLRDETNGSGIKISTLKLDIDGTTYTNVSTGMSVTSVTNGYDVTYTPQTALSDGSHTIKIDIEDNDGNKATQVTRSFTVDTVPPELGITKPAEPTSYINVASYSVIGHTNDATSSPVTVKITLNTVDQGAVTVDGSGNFAKAITLTEGSNALVIRATDSAGKYSESSYTVILDTVAPVVSSISIVPNPVNVGNSYVIKIGVTDS